METAGGDLLLGCDGIEFGGKAVISGGTIELGASRALGSGYVAFVAPASGSAVLQLDAAAVPTVGATLANTLSDFSASGEVADLAALAYVSGASATLSGATLTLTDGTRNYGFHVAGAKAAGAYQVTSDGHGGTEIAALIEVAAAFAPAPAGSAATISAGATSGPLLTAPSHG